MNRSLFFKFTSLVPVVMSAVVAFAQSAEDTLAIKNILKAEADSWNNADAESYSRHFADDGTFTNILGMFFTGHKEFLARHTDIFKGVFRGTVMRQNIVSLKFLAPDIAIVETLTVITGFAKAGPPKAASLDDEGRLRTRLLQVLKKNAGGWRIVVYHNVDIKSGIAVPEPD